MMLDNSCLFNFRQRWIFMDCIMAIAKCSVENHSRKWYMDKEIDGEFGFKTAQDCDCTFLLSVVNSAKISLSVNTLC